MRIAVLLLTLLVASCASTPDASQGATFVLVRHAEKASDDPRDPTLTEAGQRRAERLAWSLRQRPVTAVYATPLRRAQQTAAPVAREHGLPVTTYEAAASPVETAQALRAAHASGTVLVVGHSNTVPAIAAALCGCAIGPIAETEYGRRITLTVLPDGRVTVDDRREP
ncbi:SixA phosphatase family protein [Lysobacter humi (ex Lee et al. 2017)]